MGASETSVLEKTFEAGGTIVANTWVKFGASDDLVVAGAGATDTIIGVAQHGAASGERVRVMLAGISRVRAGGNITRGAFLTSAADAEAVAAAATNVIGGQALASGVDQDLIPVMLSQGMHT